MTEYLATLFLGLSIVGDILWEIWRWLRRGQRKKTRAARAATEYGDHPSRPVILIHGYQARGLTVCLLAWRLRRAGRMVWTPTFGPPWASIEHCVSALTEVIWEALDETGAEEVDLVAHSMGGLVARACLLREEIGVARLITLGTPHLGSRFWVFSFGACGREMRPGSEFLQNLRAQPLPAGLRAFSLYSDFDALVSPASASGWEGAEKIPLSGVGHIGLVMRRKAAKAVLRALED